MGVPRTHTASLPLCVSFPPCVRGPLTGALQRWGDFPHRAQSLEKTADTCVIQISRVSQNRKRCSSGSAPVRLTLALKQLNANGYLLCGQQNAGSSLLPPQEPPEMSLIYIGFLSDFILKQSFIYFLGRPTVFNSFDTHILVFSGCHNKIPQTG